MRGMPFHARDASFVGPAARRAPLLATRVAAPLCAAVAEGIRQLPLYTEYPAAAISTKVVRTALPRSQAPVFGGLDSGPGAAENVCGSGGDCGGVLRMAALAPLVAALAGGGGAGSAQDGREGSGGGCARRDGGSARSLR
eukprot:scaffold103817_cov30-Phaeocystis_antarctica.AAC.1